MPPLIAAISAITIGEVLSAVATIAISVAGQFVISALTQAIGGSSTTADTSQDSHTITLKQPLAPWQAVYGRTRVGGVYVYIHTTGPISGGDQSYQNAQLMAAIVLTCHQVDAIEKVYFGDEEIVLDADGKATGRFAMYVQIIKHLGSPAQVADQMLIDNSNGTWTSAHRLQGRAYLAVRLFYQKDLFPSMPQISALVRGKIIADPRGGAAKWTDNAVACIFDYMRGADGFQMGIAQAEMDIPNWQAEANACDEIVQTAPTSGVVGFNSTSFSAVPSKVFRPNLSKPAVTTPSAFSLPDDNLGLITGQRVQLSGLGLPVGVAANTDYWVIRLHDNSTILEGLNVSVKPTIQLASSAANAAAGTYVPITSNGSGQMTRLDEFWMRDLGLAALRTGDNIQVSALGGALPAPFVAGTTYYWIALGLDQVRPLDQGGATTTYGHGLLASTMANAMAGAAIPIQTVGSGSMTITRQYERRFTCNGVVDTNQKPVQIIGQLLSSCGGRLMNAGGLWRIATAIWRAPGPTIDEGDFRGPVSVQTLISRRDLFNAVAGTYTSPANQYQPTNFPPYPNQARPDLDVYLAQDGGERIWSNDIALPFTNSPAMAQRLAKIMLMQIRQQISVMAPVKLGAGFGITVPDNIYLTNARMGWTAKVFEVVNWTFRLDTSGPDGAPVPGIDLDLRENEPDVYSWDSGLELPDPASENTHLPLPTYVPTPGAPWAVEEIYVTQTGAGAKSRIHVSWVPIEDGFTGRYQVAYWSSIDQLWRYPPPFTSETGTETYLYDLPPATYILCVRAINILGVAGPWSAQGQIVTKGLVAPPHDLTNFRVAAMNGHAHLTWDLSTDIDVINGGQIWLRWTAKLINPTWGQGSNDLKLSGQATEATIFLKAGTYMARAVDSSGNLSANAVMWALQTVATPGWQTVIHTNEAPTFPGVKTNLVVSGGGLQLGVGGIGADVDSWPDVDAVPNWDNEGAVLPDGIYEFNTKIDLGAVFGFRMELFVDPDEFGGNETDATIFPEISLTDDNPASPTAVWSGWQYYIIGDYVARGVKRRIRFQSYNPASNVRITVLNDDCRMFQSQYSQAGVAIAAAGTRWNFNPPFYSQPFVSGNVVAAVAGDLINLTWDANARSYVTVRVTNAGAGVARNVDLLAYGPGQQQ
jgi:hypothetical protein